jgi:cysteamine dioxygenase
MLQIAVFFLPKGTVMPLHDHPGMTVFSKLLIGSAHVEGYDWIRHPRTFSTIDVSDSRRLAEKVVDHDVTPASGTWVLFPDSGGNMHRFVAGEEVPCAFLDVLTPPYAPTGRQRRRCTYYRDLPCDLCACKYSIAIAPCVKHDRAAMS